MKRDRGGHDFLGHGLVSRAEAIAVLVNRFLAVFWLVVWNMNGLLFHILGISSSQLTLSHIFQRGSSSTNQFDCFDFIIPQVSTCAKRLDMEICSFAFDRSSRGSPQSVHELRSPGMPGMPLSPTLGATPLLAHTTFAGFRKILKRDIEGRIGGNLKDVSAKSLGNHQIPTLFKFIFKGIFNMAQEFLGKDEFPTPRLTL
jgi:hypothetical protein